MSQFGSAARLFVLGCLRDGPRHGYAIRQEAVQDRVDAWSALKPGSVYHALKALERDNCVQVETVGRTGRRPTKTTYAMTPAGLTELRRLVEKGLRTVDPPADDVASALRLADQLDEEELVDLLAQRVATLDERVMQHRVALEYASPHLSEMERVAFDHTIDSLQFEADWFKRLHDRLTQDRSA